VIYSISEDLPTCPQCGRPIRLARRVGDSAHVEPCGHYIAPTVLRPAHVDESDHESGEQPVATDGGKENGSDDTTLRRRGYYEVYVRESSSGHALGWGSESKPPESDGRLADYGSGSDLKGPGFDEIEDRLDLEELNPGTYVATLWIDLDAWTYQIEWADDFGPGLVERLRRWFS